MMMDLASTPARRLAGLGPPLGLPAPACRPSPAFVHSIITFNDAIR